MNPNPYQNQPPAQQPTYEQSFTAQIQQQTPPPTAPNGSNRRKIIIIASIIIAAMLITIIILAIVLSTSNGQPSDSNENYAADIFDDTSYGGYDAQYDIEMLDAVADEAKYIAKARSLLSDPVISVAPYTSPDGTFEVDAWGEGDVIKVVLMPTCTGSATDYQANVDAGVLWIAQQNPNATSDYALTITTCDE